MSSENENVKADTCAAISCRTYKLGNEIAPSENYVALLGRIATLACDSGLLLYMEWRGLSVTFLSPRKTAEPIKMPFGEGDNSCGPKVGCLGWGSVSDESIRDAKGDKRAIMQVGRRILRSAGAARDQNKDHETLIPNIQNIEKK